MSSDPPSIPLRRALPVWAKIGLLGFGGPAGQIALMHRELVDRRRWIDDERFLHALNYCTLLPGPEAQQLATYVGWLMHRTPGAIVAGGLFVLPGFIVVVALSMLYATSGQAPLVAAVFFGLKAAVLAIVAEALARIAKRALKSSLHWLIAAAGFTALFFFDLPFPLVVLGAGIVGAIGHRTLAAGGGHASAAKADGGKSLVEAMAERGELEHTKPSRVRTLRVLVACLVLWVAPVAVIAVLLGPSSVWVHEARFFSETAVVTFGGAYAVLAYIAQRAVEDFGWLRPGEMLDGLGLAETTPGPLILVVVFVGFLAGFRDPGIFAPLVGGLLGALVTVWVTFVPCFLWILVGAPHVEKLRSNRRLAGALSAITAAVVGVILNISIWFALHVLFGEVAHHDVGPLRLLIPELATLDVAALALSVAALVAVLRFHQGLVRVLLAAAVLGVVVRAILGA
jgi:chromate transporter